MTLDLEAGKYYLSLKERPFQNDLNIILNRKWFKQKKNVISMLLNPLSSSIIISYRKYLNKNSLKSSNLSK